MILCTEMNANMLTQHFVNITRPHSTQHHDYFVWSENHERHKLVKMKIRIATNEFKELYSEGEARRVNRKKSPTQTNKPLTPEQQDFSLTSHQPAICKCLELQVFLINTQQNTRNSCLKALIHTQTLLIEQLLLKYHGGLHSCPVQGISPSL